MTSPRRKLPKVQHIKRQLPGAKKPAKKSRKTPRYNKYKIQTYAGSLYDKIQDHKKRYGCSSDSGAAKDCMRRFFESEDRTREMVEDAFNAGFESGSKTPEKFNSDKENYMSNYNRWKR